MAEQLGAAVIGLGMMGERHAAIWRELPTTRLVSVYDIVPERTQAVAEACGCEAAGSLEAALDRPDVDLVSVCTDDGRHVEPCLAAAAAGKHILLEKPLATSLQDCDAIIAACASAGVKLMVGHVVRFDPRYAVAQQAIAEGAVGEVIQVYGRRNNILDSGRRIAPRTSVAFFLGVHDLDLMRWFVGAEAVKVHAEAASKVLVDVAAEDSIMALLKYENGAVGCLETCWAMPKGIPCTLDARLEVIGSEGMVRVTVGDEGCTVISPDRASRPDILYGPHLRGEQHGALRAQLEHFADCVRLDREPLISPRDARAAVELAVAIHESLRTGAPVYL
ncbi:MAG: Gfo/Idh/MocA family oxidoreductase [Armatimonadetes bacterium]|nr:Gfo/Idh/MocA family oxidoreductase [Armatimonadota bacterium]